MSREPGYTEYKTWSNNCARLAEILSGVPDNQHNQSKWGLKGHSCGTVGCALGWAAMSEQFQDQGLEWKFDVIDEGPGEEQLERLYFTHGRDIVPPHQVGHRLFGVDVFDNVFMDLFANKQETIDKLMYYAQEYCDAAKALAPNTPPQEE